MGMHLVDMVIYIYIVIIYIYILYFNGKFFDDMRLQFVTLSHSGFAKLCLANALAQGDSNRDCQGKQRGVIGTQL